jgi:hypothetical protein
VGDMIRDANQMPPVDDSKEMLVWEGNRKIQVWLLFPV